MKRAYDAEERAVRGILARPHDKEYDALVADLTRSPRSPTAPPEPATNQQQHTVATATNTNTSTNTETTKATVVMVPSSLEAAVRLWKTKHFLWRAAGKEVLLGPPQSQQFRNASVSASAEEIDVDQATKPQSVNVTRAAPSRDAARLIGKSCGLGLVSLCVDAPSGTADAATVKLAVQSALRSSPNVSRLHLEGFASLPDAEVLRAISGLRSLCDLSVTSCESVRAHHVESFPESLTSIDLSGTLYDGRGLGRFKFLSSLRLSRCRCLNAEVFARAVATLPLRVLDLSCSLQDIPADLLYGVLHAKPALREISLSFVKNAVPALIKAITPNDSGLPRLRLLDIGNCQFGPCEAATLLPALGHVRELNLAGCSGVSRDNVGALRSIAGPRLNVISDYSNDSDSDSDDFY